MRTTRVFIDHPPTVESTLDLPESAARHVALVLRLRPGAALEVFCGDGRAWQAELVQADKRGTRILVGEETSSLSPSPLRCCLLQGVARGEKMDWILQKATEMGVSEVWPVVTERTEVRLSGDRLDKREAHWRGVLIAACEQSGRSDLPALYPCKPLDQALATLAASSDSTRLLLDPRAMHGFGDLPKQAPERLLLLVGPEGGLSQGDQALAARAGFAGVRLGPRVLRTETAGLAALAAAQYKWGDLATG